MKQIKFLLLLFVSPLIAMSIFLKAYSQSTDRHIPTDNEITNILVEGTSWLFGSREYCSTHKLLFYEDGSYGAYKYDEGFRDYAGVWHEPSWYLDSSPMGSYFSVENGVLRLSQNTGRNSSTSYSSIINVSRYKIDFIQEGDYFKRPLVNCSVSDQEFAAGTEGSISQDTAYRQRFVIPSLENVRIESDLSDTINHSMLEGYSERSQNLADDIVFKNDMYDCHSEERVAFGCSESIQYLMDDIILRRRRLGSEDTIRVSSNYENNCFDRENRFPSFDFRFVGYKFAVHISDNAPLTEVDLGAGYQGSAERYYVSCTISHDEARDMILSGLLFILSDEALYVDLKEARRRAKLLTEQYSGWNNQLRSCPCTQQEAENDVWLKDATYPVITSTFHPHAVWEYRTEASSVRHILPKSDTNLPTIRPGQQCTYDRDGRLITKGPGAGTPDAYSPEVTYVGQGLVTDASHNYWDVETFKAEGMTWQEYQKTWIPNNGNNCSDNTGFLFLAAD